MYICICIYIHMIYLDEVGLLHELAKDVLGVVLAARAHRLHVEADLDLCVSNTLATR